MCETLHLGRYKKKKQNEKERGDWMLWCFTHQQQNRHLYLASFKDLVSRFTTHTLHAFSFMRKLSKINITKKREKIRVDYKYIYINQFNWLQHTIDVPVHSKIQVGIVFSFHHSFHFITKKLCVCVFECLSGIHWAFFCAQFHSFPTKKNSNCLHMQLKGRLKTERMQYSI